MSFRVLVALGVLGPFPTFFEMFADGGGASMSTPAHSFQTYSVFVTGRLDVRLAVALAREVAAPPAARDRPCLSLARLRLCRRDPVLRRAIHGAIPAPALRLQPRRSSLDVARRLPRVRRARDRPVPAVHPEGRSGLPGDARDPVSEHAAPRTA